MKVAVCVPYRPDPDRTPLWDVCRSEWERAGFEVFEGDSGADPFHVASSRNAAAEQAGDWDVMVITDADLIPNTDSVSEALAPATWGCYIAAHNILIRLTAGGTAAALSGEPLCDQEQESSILNTWESVRVVNRKLWEELGGFDERFTSGEGLAFFYAAGTLSQIRRVPGTVYHLWHPYRWDGGNGLDLPHNQELWRRYQAAHSDQDEMRRILDERS